MKAQKAANILNVLKTVHLKKLSTNFQDQKVIREGILETL